MKELLKFKREIKDSVKRKKYTEALHLVMRVLRKFPYFTPFLILKADLMQLQEDRSKTFSKLTNKEYFDEIKKSLEFVVELDENSIEALVELGYYFFVHKNDNKTAKHFFSKAIEKSRKQYINAHIGLIKVFIDCSDYENAKLFIKKIKQNFGSLPELKDIEEDIS